MFDLDAFIVRPFNNYGPRQNSTGALAGIVPLTACRIMNGIAPEIHGDGQQSRDFIHVNDTVDAVIKLYQVLNAGESVNISTDNPVTVASLIEMICAEMDYDGEIFCKPGRKSDVSCHVASNAKLRNLIDFSVTPFQDGLKATIDWYRRNSSPPNW